MKSNKIILPAQVFNLIRDEIGDEKSASPTQLIELQPLLLGYEDWVEAIAEQTYGGEYALFIPATIVPYTDGDCVGDRFDSDTDFMDDVIPNPPIIFSHGKPLDGLQEGAYAVLGKQLERWRTPKGLKALIGIYKDAPRLAEIKASWEAGTLGFSTKRILRANSDEDPNLIRKWLIGEISIILPGYGIQPCDLQAKADDYNGQNITPEIESRLNNILELQPEELRQNLLQLLGRDDLPVFATNAPATAGAKNLTDFNESEEKGTDIPMTDTEKKEIVDSTAAAVLAGLKAAGIVGGEKSTSEEEKCDCNDMKKMKADDTEDAKSFDPLAALDSAVNSRTAKVAYTAKATEAIDNLIRSGQYDPSSRLQGIQLMEGAIKQSSDEKSSAPIENLLAVIGAAQKQDVSKLKAFGYSGADTTGADEKSSPDNLKMMIEAAMA